MALNLSQQLRAPIEAFATKPEDDVGLRLQKTLLFGSAGLMSLGGLAWGVFTLPFSPAVATIPFGYTALSVLNAGAYRWSGWSYDRYRAVQLMLTLLLPFFMAVAMGGFAPSAGVIAWSLLAPMGATLFCTERRARWWFGGFVVVVALAALLDPLVGHDSILPATFLPWFGALNVGVPTFAAFVLLRHFVIQKDEALEALHAEQARSERLLLNVLPAEIAEVLKHEERTIAEKFDHISVLFADIVGFTKLSMELPPEQMVEVLNEVFSAFDALTAKYGAEKIRTIGDNYMVAAGAPRPREDHAEVMVAMALDMLAYLETRPDSDFQFRIGINSGPAVGGVVGKQKFHYDVWGDTVNVASRMESHGEPGRVHIGPATHALIKHRFECVPRGPIEIKGKGTMETWFVMGRLPES